jgi:predicted HTH domain antitoxin
MSLHVIFPEELLVAAREDRESFSRKVMIYTLGHLYQQGKISAGIGAKALGCTKLVFYRLLSEHGFPILDYPPDELESEAQSSMEIAARARPR